MVGIVVSLGLRAGVEGLVLAATDPSYIPRHIGPRRPDPVTKPCHYNIPLPVVVIVGLGDELH